MIAIVFNTCAQKVLIKVIFKRKKELFEKQNKHSKKVDNKMYVMYLWHSCLKSCSSTMNIFTTQFFCLRFREHYRIGVKRWEEWKDQDILYEVVAPTVDKELSPMMTQQHGILNKTWIGIIPKIRLENLKEFHP